LRSWHRHLPGFFIEHVFCFQAMGMAPIQADKPSRLVARAVRSEASLRMRQREDKTDGLCIIFDEHKQ
jgi:hypothetical protein